MAKRRLRRYLYRKQKKRVVWIALTGGPCSGKSTSLSELKQELENRGINVLLIDEAATRVINSGVNAKKMGVIPMQNLIARTQVENELNYEMLIEETDYDYYVVICDRGLMDGAAYIDPNEFDHLLQKTFGFTAAEARDSYDLVIHMVTAADGAASNYNYNNEARTETIPEACALDKKTQNAWIGHPNYHIVDNVGVTFEEKKKKVRDIVYAYLGEPIPLQSYKKYRVDFPNISFIEGQKAYTKVSIHRFYLPDQRKNDKIERSITERVTRDEATYYYSERRHIEDADRIYVEYKITKKEFDAILRDTIGPVRELKKERHCFTFNNSYYELDVFPFTDDYAVLKIQLTNKGTNAYEIPYFFENATDVTNDDCYKNYSLASIVTR